MFSKCLKKSENDFNSLRFYKTQTKMQGGKAICRHFERVGFVVVLEWNLHFWRWPHFTYQKVLQVDYHR